MTAINPTRLKIQSAKLTEYFTKPDQFISGLHDLLTFYAARIRQTSLTINSAKIESYQVPPPVLRELVLNLLEEANQHPAETLKLVDSLWKENWLEFKQLAVILTGSIPASHLEEIMKRIRKWGKTSSEELRQLIMTSGLERLRMEKKYQVLDLLKDLGASTVKKDQQAALFGLRPFVEDPEFADLPKIYKILGDILSKDETAFIKEITVLIQSLKKRSESETANFLVRQLSRASKPRILRITRGIMKDFSEDSRALLRESLGNYS